MPSIISLLSSLTLPAVFEHKPWNIMLIGSRDAAGVLSTFRKHYALHRSCHQVILQKPGPMTI